MTVARFNYRSVPLAHFQTAKPKVFCPNYFHFLLFTELDRYPNSIESTIVIFGELFINDLA